MKELLRRHASHYGPLLDELQTVLEHATGPLVWRDRDGARLLDDHSLMRVEDPVIRVGPVFGAGVAISTVDRAALVAALNDVAARHGFTPLCGFVTEPWGLLRTSSVDGFESVLHVELFGYAKAWVDVAVGG